MLRTIRVVIGLGLLAHGLVHLTIYPGADAYGGGRLGWDGAVRFGADAAGLSAAGHLLILATVVLYAAAGLAMVVRPLLRFAGSLTGAASVVSLAAMWWMWPGLTPTPEHFWRGPVISVACLLLVPALMLAGQDGGAFARSRLAASGAATWGTTADERAASSPSQTYAPDATCTLWRGVDVEAPAATVYQWLGQLRLAPYSYDLLDNRGHRSPRRLDPTLPALAVGQPILSIFEVVEVEPDRLLTMASSNAPPTALTYRVTPTGPGTCRLVVRADAACRTHLGAVVLTFCDLIMMRRQLLTLARLAARDAPSLLAA